MAVTGWFMAPTAPAVPDPVTVAASGSSADVSWNGEAADGGSPITGYTVTATPDDVSVTAGPDDTAVTMSGLANLSADTFTVTATNAMGSTAATGTVVIAGSGGSSDNGGSGGTTAVAMQFTESDGATPMADADVTVYYWPPAAAETSCGSNAPVSSAIELGSGTTNAEGFFAGTLDTSSVSDTGDIGQMTSAFNATIEAIDPAGHLVNDDVILNEGSTTSSVAAASSAILAPPGDVPASDGSPASLTESCIATQYRYIPVTPLNAGNGIKAPLSYTYNSSVAKQTSVTIATTFSSQDFGSAGWSVGESQLEETDRSAQTTVPEIGSFHTWIWANYLWKEYLVCNPTKFTKCWAEWRANHWQGSISSNNTNCCIRGNTIGQVAWKVPKFTPGANNNDYVIITGAAWVRAKNQFSSNTASGTFTLGVASGITLGLSTTTTFGNVTSASWVTNSSQTNCGSGYEPIVWGDNNDPVDAKIVESSCEPGSKL